MWSHRGESKGDFDDLRADEPNAMSRLMVRYGRDQLPEFALGGAASIVARILELLPPLLLGVAIDALFIESRTFDEAMPVLPTAWLPTTEQGQFWLLTGLLLGSFVLGAGLNWVNSWAWNHFAQYLQHDIRTDTYDAMQRLELEFFDNKQTGEVMSILNNDVNQLENFLTSNLDTFVRIFVMVGGVGVLMFWLNWQLALVSFVAIPILALASWKFVQLIHPKYGRVRSAVGALNSRLENNLGGIEVIKAYNTEPFESERVSDASKDYLDANWDAITTRIRFFPALRIITGLAFVATFFIGGYWVIFGPPWVFSGTLTAGTLVTFLMYTQRFMWPMHQFGNIINSYQYASAASDRILGLLDTPSTVREIEGATDLDDVEGRIAYDHVSFSYAGGEQVLEDISFVAEPGEMIGLVGPTGAGKTTLLKLLIRLYDPDEGTITVDGVDVRDVTLDSLRRSVSYVSQDPFLFYGSVRENIAYADPDLPEEAVVEAAKRAGAHEFIQNLPDGYDTMVGERGVKLSGGQRQRVSIARAIITDPEVLILDEATSHVDNETEVLIQNSLQELVADRTTFAIAHRLSTVRNADRILVLDDGRLVEEGSHEELLDEDGLYANLWGVQVGEMESLPEEFLARTARRQATVEDD